MSSKVELTISSGYVANWTIADAVRELFQNAFDQEIQEGSAASWSYSDGILSICNEHSMLSIQSLLLGQSTKSTDATTVGQFGEGYKLATLALIRAGKQVVIKNYGAREVWKPRFVKSRRFDAEVLTFFIDKYFWSTPPTNDLTIEIHGITEDEYAKIVSRTLQLQDNVEIIQSTEYGDILGDTHKCKVFVNGLFVCENNQLSYGYNFKPTALALSRDRRLASDFDIQWAASRMWATTADALDLIKRGCYDAKYIQHMSGTLRLVDKAYADFIEMYGINAIPVTCQDELEKLPAGYKGIIVNADYASLIKICSKYSTPSSDKPTLSDLVEMLDKWHENYEPLLHGNANDEFLDIYNKLYEVVNNGLC